MSTPPSSSLLAITAEHERQSRDPWQQPERVIAALELRGGETIVDLGAGTGYFTWRLAAAVPRGKVWAIEPDASLRRALDAEALRRNASQVAVAEAAVGPVDLVFACNLLRVLSPERFFELAPGTRLVVIDFSPEAAEAPNAPPVRSRISTERLSAMLQTHFALEARLALPRQYLLGFRRRP